MNPQDSIHRAYSVLTVKAASEDGDKRIIRGIATTPKPDRMEDVVESDGAQFELPLPLLSQHDPTKPIGHVTHVNVTRDGIEIEATVAKDTGLFYVDNAWAQIKAGLVRGLSIGFRALEYAFIEGSNGIRFTKWDWLELSAVTIPANAGATIQTVKAYHAAAAALARKAAPRSTPTPPPAASALPVVVKPQGAKMTLAEMIAAKNADIAQFREGLDAITKRVEDGEDLSDDDAKQVDTLAEAIEKAESDLATYKRMQAAQKSRAVTGRDTGDDPAHGRKGAPAVLTMGRTIKRIPGELIFRHAAAALVKHVKGGTIEEVSGRLFPSDREMPYYLRAAQNPADTTTPGWAAELVQETYMGFMGLLENESLFPRLAAKGVQLGALTAPVKIPARADTKRISGAWVGEGQPIPVRGAQLTSQTLAGHKLAVISTFTRELADASSPQIQGLIEQFMVEDTALTIDQNLLDNIAANATRPAGLKQGSLQHASTGNTLEDIARDLQTLILDLSSKNGLRVPVWLINPGNVAILSFATNAIGEVPEFLRGLGSGTLAGFPFIASGNVPMSEVWLIDAADFVSAGGGAPDFNVSDVATIHEEDTNPEPINDGTPATPVRSLWQTYSVGVRMILPLSWAMRRTGMVSILTNIDWAAPPEPTP